MVTCLLASQGAQLQADGNTVRTLAAVLQKVALKLDGGVKGLIHGYVCAWGQVASASMALVQGNGKIASYANPEELLDADSEHKLLKTVCACRMRLLKHKQEIERTQEQAAAAEPPNEDLVGLMTLEVPANLMSELDSFAFDNVVEHYCGRVVRKVTTLLSEMDTACEGRAIEWKASLAEDADFETVLEAAKLTILTLQGKTIKTTFNDFSEAGL